MKIKFDAIAASKGEISFSNGDQKKGWRGETVAIMKNSDGNIFSIWQRKKHSRPLISPFCAINDELFHAFPFLSVYLFLASPHWRYHEKCQQNVLNKKQTEEIRRSFSSRSRFLLLYRCRSVILSLPAERRNKRRRGDTKLEIDQYRNFSILIFRFSSSPFCDSNEAGREAKRREKLKEKEKLMTSIFLSPAMFSLQDLFICLSDCRCAGSTIVIISILVSECRSLRLMHKISIYR